MSKTITLFGTTGATTTTDALTTLSPRRRVDAGLVLQLAAGLLLAGVSGEVMGAVGDAAARIVTQGVDTDDLAVLLDTHEVPDRVAFTLHAKAQAVLGSTAAFDLYPTADLSRMASELRSISGALEALRIMITQAKGPSHVIDHLVEIAVGEADRAVALLDQAVEQQADGLRTVLVTLV